MVEINTNENQDLRIVKTEYAIKKAFVSLLKKKPYSKISVTEIVEKAQINRNTFYLHYIDKEDLLDSLVVDEFGKYNKVINKAIDDYATVPVDLTEDELRSSIKSMLIDLSKDIDFYRLIMKDKDIKGYILKIKEIARNRFSCMIDSNDHIKQLCMEFCFEGIFGLLFRWIDEGSTLASLDEISIALTKIIYECYKTIRGKV